MTIPLPLDRAALLAKTHRIALDPQICQALTEDPIIVYSLSGGKDSSAAALATQDFLDSIGHPRANRFSIHANLGLIEWPGTEEFVSAVAERIGTPLTTVQAAIGGLIPRWQQRFENAKARYERLETFALIGPWSSASLRFCTGEQKAAPIGSALSKQHRGRTIISVIGIRHEESAARANAPISKQDDRFASNGNRHGTRMLSWHPIVHWNKEMVYEEHRRRSFPLHYAYTDHGSSRLSCSACVLASSRDLTAAINSGRNDEAIRTITALEIRSTFAFQPTRWLSDLAAHRLSSAKLNRLSASKQMNAERKAAEATLPSDLRFTRGWPPRVPTADEASTIAAVRSIILAQHGLQNHYLTPATIIDRFAELHARTLSRKENAK